MRAPLPNNPFPVAFAADWPGAVAVYVNGERFLLSNEACRELERELQRIRMKSEERATRASLCLTIPALKLAKIPQFCWISVADFDSRRDRNFQANFNFLLANRQFFKHGPPGQVIRG